MKLLPIAKLNYIVICLILLSCCTSSKKIHNTFNRYVGSSHMDFMQDLSFLDIPGKNFKNSSLQITYCIANPYTCTTKFFFINRNKENTWEAISYRYNRCWQDSTGIERVKIDLNSKWDSVFSILTNENLFNLQNQKKTTKEFEVQLGKKYKKGLVIIEGDINYSFLFNLKNKINNIEINSIEKYRNYYSEYEFDISEIEKLIRLKYLFSLIFTDDTDYRFKK
ncbi:hypothetical protein [Ferruginibacter sp.]|nr:hypothetical protein [Ferruginibacter sp.]